MKTQFSSALALLFTLVLLFSCAEPIDQSLTNKKEALLAQRELQTKAINDQLSRGIGETEVKNYLSCWLNISEQEIKDITRYDISKEVYVFIVNLKNGHWYMFSGDYATEPLIAKGDGVFNLDFENDRSHYLEHWFETIQDKILDNRYHPEKESVNKNKKRWAVAQRIAQSRRDDDTTEVESILILDTLNYGYCPGLTVTQWDENLPFNDALPLYESNEHCFAGCAVVAIAQLIYYTHFALGYPSDIYESASCSQYYNAAGTPPYAYSFNNPSTTCWNLMGLTASANYLTPYVAALYALVAQRSNTEYVLDEGIGVGNTSVNSVSSTLSSFLLYGANNTTYNRGIVMSEINNDRPVLVTGGSSLYDTIGHTFLYDGYEWMRLRWTEIVMDLNGNTLDIIQDLDEFYSVRINTGESIGGHIIWDYSDSYYSYNRVLFVGWE